MLNEWHSCMRNLAGLPESVSQDGASSEGQGGNGRYCFDGGGER